MQFLKDQYFSEQLTRISQCLFRISLEPSQPALSLTMGAYNALSCFHLCLLRSDLPDYLADTEADGVMVLTWRHRQFR